VQWLVLMGTAAMIVLAVIALGQADCTSADQTLRLGLSRIMISWMKVRPLPAPRSHPA
jgi:hypothetical protein